MAMTAGTRTSGFGQKYSPAPTAAARTTTSPRRARSARAAERRVKRSRTSFGSAFRKSSLNSSPLLVEAADEDVLHLQVLFEPVLRALAAEARLLDAAEGRDLGRDDADVCTHDAGLDRLRDAEDAPDVAAVEVAAEAELGVVRELDDLVFGLEADQRRHRAEGLLVRHQHLRRHVGD